MANRTTIVNLALGHLGQYRVVDIDERSPTGEAVRDVWDLCRDSVLRAHHWNFATAVAVLSKLADAPPFGWSYQWALPADFIKLVACNEVYSGTRDTEFTVRGGVLCTMEDKAEVEYVQRVTVCERWEPQFVEAFALKLAEMIAPRLTLSGGKAAELADRARRAGAGAAHSDAIDSRPHVRRAEDGSRYQQAIRGWDPDIG